MKEVFGVNHGESLLCVGLTESRNQHRWVAEYESDSQHFVRRDACESVLSQSGIGHVFKYTIIKVLC